MAKSKYVQLLNKTFDKYQDIETIGVSLRANASETGAQREKMVQDLSPKLLSSTDTESGGVKIKSKGQGPLIRVPAKWVKEKKNRKSYNKQKPFSPEEDEVLRNAIQTGVINFVEIAKEIARDPSSIRKRIIKLNSSGRSRHRKIFQFERDFVLNDAAIQDLLKCSSLEITKV